MKNIPKWIKSLVVFVVIYLTVFQPIPYYIEKPGSAFGLDGMVEVDGNFDENPGEFFITTVGIRQVTPLTALSSFLPYQDLVSEEELFGDIDDFNEYDVIQQYYMESSSNTAIQVAFEAAEMEYELVYNGVHVLQVLKESAFSDSLKVGDIVKAVDGNVFQSSHEFIEYISELNVGDSVTIEFEREGSVHSASGELIPLESGVAGIGIGLADNTSLKTTPEVTIHSGSIGGPSAGLMFSLHIYDQLIEEDVLGINKIAGTGTISPDGTVGRIGGISKKVIAANEEGVKYFFAPVDEIPEEVREIYPEIQTNYQEALEAAEDINADLEVVPVKTFSDAIEFLEQLNENEMSSIDNATALYVLPFHAAFEQIISSKVLIR